jgi:hypothetical protein
MFEAEAPAVATTGIKLTNPTFEDSDVEKSSSTEPHQALDAVVYTFDGDGADSTSPLSPREKDVTLGDKRCVSLLLPAKLRTCR